MRVSIMTKQKHFGILIFWVLRVTNLFQEALVTQFLGNYLLMVHLFFTKSYPRDQVRDGTIPGQLFKDCIGRYSNDYGRRISVVSRSCEMVSQEKHLTVKTVLALGRTSSDKNLATIFIMTFFGKFFCQERGEIPSSR